MSFYEIQTTKGSIFLSRNATRKIHSHGIDYVIDVVVIGGSKFSLTSTRFDIWCSV